MNYPEKLKKLAVKLPLSGSPVNILNPKDFDEITINPPSDYDSGKQLISEMLDTARAFYCLKVVSDPNPIWDRLQETIKAAETYLGGK